jgi:uncharacterized protein (TIGR02145 family)
VLFISQSAFTQKIILHRNTGGDQTYYVSSVDSITFLPFACGDEIRYEGKTYGTVLIGTQCWFKENLDIGVMISGNSDQTNNSPANYIEKYCYGDIPTNCDAYGGLYQWNEAMQYVTTVGTQGICPAGWHLPTLVEFQTLAATVGNNGNALKEIGQGVDPGEGTNTSGFSALLAGTRHYNGNFYYLGNDAVFWISTDYNVGESNYFYLPYDLSNIIFDHNSKNYGFSVRCLKDQ